MAQAYLQPALPSQGEAMAPRQSSVQHLWQALTG